MKTTVRERKIVRGGIVAESRRVLIKYVLIKRAAGGIGDILMHRMLFKDLKKNFEDKELTLAIPEQYIPLVVDHPYIDRIISIDEIHKNRYGKTFNTLGKAGAYEFAQMPFVNKHRSDIWANYLGIELTEHEGYLTFTPDELSFADDFIDSFNGDLNVGIAPITAHPSKDISKRKIKKIISRLDRAGCRCFVFNDKPLGFRDSVDVNLDLRHWMAVTAKMDVVVTLATSMFHLANLLHKPTVAIFGVEDLSVFGKYFPEMVAVQRSREEPDWPFCPCWNSRDCKLRESDMRDSYPPECLKSITAKEVYEKVIGLTNGKLAI